MDAINIMDDKVTFVYDAHGTPLSIEWRLWVLRFVYLKAEVNGGFMGEGLQEKDVKDFFSEPFTETKARLPELKERYLGGCG